MPEILYNDDSVVVAVKPAGVSSQEDGTSLSMPALLRSQLKYDYIAAVHRLDKDVSGIMVYANTQASARELSAQASDGRMKKEYLAVTLGIPETREGIYEDLLFHDSTKNKSYVVKKSRRGVRRASLEYEVIAEKTDHSPPLALIKIRLHTGRTHQIRVQFSSRKTPILGDRRYGGGNACSVALFSHALGFLHPETGEFLAFSSPAPDDFPWNIFGSL